MASSTETIFVRLLGEGVDVWRPVAASAIGDDLFRLNEDVVPADEDWEFRPGEIVRVTTRRGSDGPFKIAGMSTTTGVRQVG